MSSKYTIVTSTYDQSSVDDVIEYMKMPISCQSVDSFGLLELELLYKDETERGLRIPSFRFTSTFGHVESFLDDIDQYISRIDKNDLLDEKRGYQFPSKETIDKYHHDYDLHQNEHFVNENSNSVVSSAKRLANRLFDKNLRYDNVCITGKVGSGKSTFIQIFLSKLLDDSSEERTVCYALITYEEFNNHFRSNLSKEDWKECFELSILNQVIFQAFNNKPNNNKTGIKMKKWVDTISIFRKFDEESIEILKNFSTLLTKEDFSDSWNGIFVENLDVLIKKAVLNFLLEDIEFNKKLKIVIVFDGFDAFSLDKIINKNYEAIVKYLSETIFTGGKVLGLRKEHYSCVISLRDCTYSRLMKMLNAEDGIHIDRWRICPPGVKKALHRGIRAYFNYLTNRDIKNAQNDSIKKTIQGENSKLEENFLLSFDNIHEEIKRFFKSDDDDVVKIFDQNYRKMKSYYILVLKQLVSDIIKDEGQKKKEEFFATITASKRIGAIIGKYDFLELLLLRDGKVFFNFFSDIDYDEFGIHAEGNVGKGLIDNVFGYSFSKFNDIAKIPISLIKIRILQFLIKEKHHVKAEEVIGELKKMGYIVKEDYMHHILHMMGEVGFVKNRFSDEAKMIVYQNTALGAYVIGELIKNNRYIEHVIQKSLLPKNLVKIMHPLCKYSFEEDSIIKWIFYSAINIYIFINYIYLIEKKEIESYANKYDVKEYNSFYSLKKDFNFLIDSLNKVFRSNFVTKNSINRYIDTNLLKQELLSANKLFIESIGNKNISGLEEPPLNTLSTPPLRQQVFISYAHADAEWLKRLQLHLKPLERDRRIDRWDDTRIKPGMDWLAFLASDFIANNELPPLLEAAEREGALILPIIVSPCSFERTPKLSRFQAANSPLETLEDMTVPDWKRVLLRVANQIDDMFQNP
mgnify:CR=1 FL=1